MRATVQVADVDNLVTFDIDAGDDEHGAGTQRGDYQDEPFARGEAVRNGRGELALSLFLFFSLSLSLFLFSLSLSLSLSLSELPVIARCRAFIQEGQERTGLLCSGWTTDARTRRRLLR